MIDKWFQNDINKVLAVHDRMVVTDALGEGGFLLDYLPSDVVVINTGNEEIDEIKARYRAEKDCIGKKVVFYKQNTPDSLCFLLEYAETYGCIVLDDMEAYIRKHLFEGIKENTELGKQELLMAAKLSKGKDLNWWHGVSKGIIKPLDTDGLVIDLLHHPKEIKKNMDGDVWKIFESEVYSLISKPQTKQPVEILAQSVADTIFDGLIHNNISDRLLKIYYKCVDSNSMREPLLNYIEKYKIPQGMSVLDTHPDHCFMELDRLYFKQLSAYFGGDGKLGTAHEQTCSVFGSLHMVFEVYIQNDGKFIVHAIPLHGFKAHFLRDHLAVLFIEHIILLGAHGTDDMHG